MATTRRHKKQHRNRRSIRRDTARRVIAQHHARTEEQIVGYSMIGCGRWASYQERDGLDRRSAHIAVTLENGTHHARMHGMFKCGNNWLCDSCARAASADLADYITKEVIPTVERQGLKMVLVTRTAAHHYDQDWTAFTDKFYKAQAIYEQNMRREYRAIGYMGKIRAMEPLIGENGLHLHAHDELVVSTFTDLLHFQERGFEVWQAALKRVGLRCSKYGFDVTTKFDPTYVAKMEDEEKAKTSTAYEVSAHDSKKSRSGNRSQWELLDAIAKGDKQAQDEFIRFARAVGGHKRFHTGNLAEKLGICSFQTFRGMKRQGESKGDAAKPVLLISYPLVKHMLATSPDNERPSMALILRAARQEPRRPGSTVQMVEALCTDYVRQKVERIKRYAFAQADAIDKAQAQAKADIAAAAFEKDIRLRLAVGALEFGQELDFG